jgi:hypothetical protein
VRDGVISNAYMDIYDINFYWIYWRNGTWLLDRLVLCVFAFIMVWRMHILMANENDYHKCVMIMDVLKLSAA